MLTAIKKRKTRRILTRASSVLLLIFYVAATAQNEVLHHFFHSEDRLLLHSGEQEKDPCHRTIYHHELKRECGHDSHIILKDKCELCGIITHTKQILPSVFECPSILFALQTFDFTSPDDVNAGESILSSRAPPLLNFILC